jgi:hypothetical protein
MPILRELDSQHRQLPGTQAIEEDVLFAGRLLFLVLLYAAAAHAGLAVAPTTTLSAETGNNTSAADSYMLDASQNSAPGNVSNIPMRELLYPGATTKIYAHFMPWFGRRSHVDVGYSSDEAAQVRKQVQDAMRRGISGFIVDWYGPRNRSYKAVQLLMAEAEQNPGFGFAVMVDKGALRGCRPLPCDATGELIAQLHYIFRTYATSPAYMRINGRPAIFNFDVDLHFTIDWARVRASAPGDPVFIFQHRSGFKHEASGGSYSWVRVVSPKSMLSYSSRDAAMEMAQALGPALNDRYFSTFYGLGKAHPHLYTIGASFKGFNDAMASWGKHRVLRQDCGATWLSTWAKVNALYDAGRQLDSMQIVTWNDYEEGTEIETGIDNCLSVSATLEGSTLQFSALGEGIEADTVDHYTVFVSADGENLMPLTDVAVGIGALDLQSYDLQPGNYTLYVKMQSKPGFLNRMSNAVSYTVEPPPAPPEPTPVATAEAQPALEPQPAPPAITETPSVVSPAAPVLTPVSVPTVIYADFEEMTKVPTLWRHKREISLRQPETTGIPPR